MRRTAKKTGLLITSAAAGLATLSQCSAGLLGDLFDKQCDKDRQEIEKRMPACDCSFGFFSTAWQPWGTCDQNIGDGCSSGQCRNSVQLIQPGYSSGPPSTDLPPVRETWTPVDPTVSPIHPDMIHNTPESDDKSPAPILMRPLQPEPATDGLVLPPSNPQPSAISQPPAANPFPRAVMTNPELPDLNANPYSRPGSTFVPNAPLPRLAPGSSVLLDSPRPSQGLPTRSASPRQPLPAPASSYGSTGSGIVLPPRRATSVTIDIPPGSTGTTLNLPDPVRSSNSPGHATSVPSINNKIPAATSEDAPPPTPEPSLRPQPPVPMPSVIQGPSARYQPPARQTVPQFQAMQYVNTQQMQSQNSASQPQQFQPATHWEPVPRQQAQQQTRWRVIPGAYQQQQATIQPTIQAAPQRRMLTPSERVLYLPPPPRR